MRIVLASVGLALFVSACGGSVSTIGDGGTSPTTDGGTSPGTDAASDAPSPGGCPSTPPASGTACPRVDLTCGYGDDPRPSCNKSFVCKSSGWIEMSTGTFCPPLVPPGATCPATMADATAAASCKPDGLICIYGDRTCVCSACDGLCSPTAKFHCDHAPTTTGCPSKRPQIGTACGVEGTSCTYGTCAGGTITTRQCSAGVWVDQPTACPA